MPSIGLGVTQVGPYITSCYYYRNTATLCNTATLWTGIITFVLVNSGSAPGGAAKMWILRSSPRGSQC